MTPGWELLGLTVSDLVIVVLMIVVFVAALVVLPPAHPTRRGRQSGR